MLQQAYFVIISMKIHHKKQQFQNVVSSSFRNKQWNRRNRLNYVSVTVGNIVLEKI